ncbi:MAG: RsmB/NOP family class I SAM-dependent RNA methyltransferase [Alphaproteobacteria bacterium]|nr:MAG: RsmB/NOP family class I SAM-dependent RNA methyltransferase [Alphaproteobacteria bacterium]
MRPAARIRAAVEAMEMVLTAMQAGGAGAEAVLARYFRARRYAGAKDRRAIQDLVYCGLRRLAELDARLAFCDLATTSRNRVLLAAIMQAGEPAADWFGGPYGLPSPSSGEMAGLLRAARLPADVLPEPARLSVPDWAWAGLARRFGDALKEEAAGWDREASVDLRVIESHLSRNRLLISLAGMGLEAEPAPWAPTAVRLDRRVGRGRLRGILDRLAIAQDEGSQIAAHLADVRPGMTVVELGAGGGGKTAALADALRGRGRVVAVDVDRRRLERARRRLESLGLAGLVEWVMLPAAPDEARERLAPWLGLADRVLVDVPCTGSGTWRRHPDRKWRWKGEDLAGLRQTQQTMLAHALALAAPAAGARVVYVTCSLLPEENEDVVLRILDRHRDWELCDHRGVLRSLGWTRIPETAALLPSCLQLAPARHHTDGLFVAVLARKL